MSYHVLIVDDESEVPEIFRQHLRRDVRQGLYRLSFAASGNEALALIDVDPDVDLVVTDINMPGMDGLSLLRALKQKEKDLHTLVLSAYGDMGNIRTAMNLGAFDFLVKPMDFDDMRQTMTRSLTDLAARREAQASKDRLQALDRQLEIAWRVQNAALPKTFPAYPNLESAGSLVPARQVSGDFYDVIRLGDDRLGLTVADVSGKGIAAAMLMMRVCTMLRGLAIGLPEPARVLEEANVLLARDNDTSSLDTFSFVTVFFAVFDPHADTITYALAGHDAPILFGRTGASAPAEGGAALGILQNETYPQHIVRLQPGDALCVFTDGITEAEDPDRAQFGMDGLQAVLDANTESNAAYAVCQVLDAVRHHARGQPQSDDLTCLILKRPA